MGENARIVSFENMITGVETKMRKPIRFYASVLGAKCMIGLMRLMGRNATNLPGEIALYFFPNLLRYFEMPKTVIAVTGTNGKTTTSNMINTILRENGYDFIDNSFGGNVDTGIASILLSNCTLGGKFKKDLALFEMDERSAPRLLPYLAPDYLVCTNLQRDSMKRNAHTEFIFNILNENIPAKTKLILNGDDLISSRLAEQNSRVYFGLDKLEGEIPTEDNIICDMKNCPKCGRPITYTFRHYNHIGRGYCEHCGFASPAIDFEAKSVSDGVVTILHDGKEEHYSLPNNRITDIYNTTAAVTLARTFGLSEEQVAAAVKKMEVVKSRYDRFEAAGCEVLVTLAKGQNPVACSAMCDFIRKEPGKKAVIMILDDANDARNSTENVAWIYETDFEFLKGDDIKQIVIGGVRCRDYLVRCLVAGIDREKVACTPNEAEVPGLLHLDDIDKILILYDVFNGPALKNICDQLKALPTGGKA